MKATLLCIALSFTLVLGGCNANSSKEDGASAPSQPAPSRSNRY